MFASAFLEAFLSVFSRNVSRAILANNDFYDGYYRSFSLTYRLYPENRDIKVSS